MCVIFIISWLLRISNPYRITFNPNLSSRNGVLLQKLTGPQLVKKFSAILEPESSLQAQFTTSTTFMHKRPAPVALISLRNPVRDSPIPFLEGPLQ